MRFLYWSSLLAFILILGVGVYYATSIWYLNSFGLHAVGTVVAANAPGWTVSYQRDGDTPEESHIDWLPPRTGVGDVIELRHSSLPWLLPQASGTPVTSALPFIAFSLVPLLAAILYRRRFLALERHMRMGKGE